MSQVCNLCRIDKPIEDFYLRDGLKAFRSCKQCISDAKVKKPKLAGYQTLPKETLDGIKADLQVRSNKIKNIATKWGINYANLCYWIRSGHL